MPTAAVRDLEMAYDLSGSAGGAPVLLVHGLGNSSLVWADTAPAAFRAALLEHLRGA